jgi:leucyl/phenylalanyl-tRNA--protein transferase
VGIGVDLAVVKAELSPEFVLRAYASGIFPMGDPEGGVAWFSPDPRAIIDLDAFHISNTLRRKYQQERFELAVNRDFPRVIRACGARPEGTWISEEIVEAYVRLHELGYAHSVECRRAGKLAGGLYGVALGGAFFGESMFHRERDASKIATVYLVRRLRERGYGLLDVQVLTPHLARFGAKEIPRREYMVRLRAALKRECCFVG